MDGYLDAFLIGLGNVTGLTGLGYVLAGTVLAMITSFLPGIGGSSIAVLVMVGTAYWEPEPVFLLFGALTGGATFMGSITAILFGIPGNASSSSALLDGHPLAKLGYPKTAIACAATASAVGSIFGVVVILAGLPLIQGFILEFGPLERLLVGIWGILSIAALPRGDVWKSVAMMGLGLMAAMIGSNPNTGLPRWTFGSMDLFEGVPTIPLLVGMFTVAELLGWTARYRIDGTTYIRARKRDSIALGIWAVFHRKMLVLRSSLIGTVVGIVPGVGGTVAGFVSYGQAMQSRKARASRFGRGDIHGLIAPEAAMDAKDGGSLIPALAFGLPGSEGGILLLSMFAIHGIVPGPDLFGPQLDLTFTLVFALLLSNVLTSLIGVALIPVLARVSNLKINRLALPFFALTAITIIQMNHQVSDFYVTVGFGLFAYFLARFDWPRVPFLIAFVLGHLIEVNLNLTVQLVEIGRLVPYERPVALFLFAVIIASLVWTIRRGVIVDRSKATTQPDEVWFPTLLLGVIGIFVVQAVLRPHTQTIVSIAALVIAGAPVTFVAAHAWGTVIRRGRETGTLALIWPGTFACSWPLTLVALSQLLIGGLGVHVGLGVLSVLWVIFDKGARPAAIWRGIMSGAVISVLSWVLLVWFGNAILPLPWLVTLF